MLNSLKIPLLFWSGNGYKCYQQVYVFNFNCFPWTILEEE